MRRSCSEPVNPRVRSAIVLLALAAFQFAPPIAAHPDLLAQIARLDAEIAANPNDVGALVRRADLHRRHADHDAAAADLGRARELARRVPQAASHLPDIARAAGRLALDRGLPAEAAAELDLYLDTRPDDPAAWRYRGRALLALGRNDEAAADFAESIRRTPRAPPDLYRSRALALAAIGPDGWTRALEAVEEGLDSHPADPALAGLATDLALALGDADAAAAHIARLPEPIRRLPDWVARLRALQCLRSADDSGADCAGDIRSRLTEHGATGPEPPG